MADDEIIDLMDPDSDELEDVKKYLAFLKN
jgi:hypothetical protein